MSVPVFHSRSRSHRPSNMAQRPPSRPSNEPKPLNFNQAMEDFTIMFPHLDSEVILTVLRSNNGVVQTTIDQLLVISENSEEEPNLYDELSVDAAPDLPSYADHQDSFPNEPPPAYTELDLSDETGQSIIDGAVGGATSSALSSQANGMSPSSQTSRFWNSTLVATLSTDFLRLHANGSYEPRATNAQRPASVSNSSVQNSADGFETDQQLERYLEDERLALFLQNEEFVRQLRHNPEFVDAVEADHRNYVEDRSGSHVASSQDGVTAPGGIHPDPTASAAVGDDAAFSLKLKHMGKSTRKRFGKLAKRFSRTRRSVKSVGHPTESTFNLLDEDEDDIHETAGMDGIDQSDGSIDNSFGSGSEASVTSPRPPAIRCIVNDEPIVFYSEDNEFELKRDGSEA